MAACAVLVVHGDQDARTPTGRDSLCSSANPAPVAGPHCARFDFAGIRIEIDLVRAQQHGCRRDLDISATPHQRYVIFPILSADRDVAVIGEPVSQPQCHAAEQGSPPSLPNSSARMAFDGIAYRSSFGPGQNIALFDLNAAYVARKPELIKVTRPTNTTSSRRRGH
jgi:hypothetical protein